MTLPKLTMPELHRPTFTMPELHRPTFRRPTWPLSIKQTVGLCVGLSLVAAAVSAMVVVIPSKPVATPGTGSVRDVDFRPAGQPPGGNFDYGPFFVTDGTRLLMIGTDVTASGGTTATATTVWSTTDGQSWDAISAPGSFDSGDRRFVVQGFASDGSGGFVAVGDATGTDTKIAPAAWHSTDGATWTVAAIDFTNNVQMIGLASRPGRIVSAGNGVAWFSEDGKSWQVMPLPFSTGYIPRVVRAWAGGFVILGISIGINPHTAVWLSTDGREWNRVAMDLAGFQVQDLAAYGNGLVAVGSQILTQKELATPTPSGKKASPTPQPSPTPKPTPTKKGATPPPTPTPTPSPSPTVPPPTVAVGIAWISPDGVHWYRSSTIGGRRVQLESITQVFDSLVAVGSEPASMAGGPTPEPSPTDPAATPTPTPRASLWTSDDGLNWKPMTTTAEPLNRSRLAAFGKSLILAGADQTGTFSVLVGGVQLGSPLPVASVTPTPPFAIHLKTGVTPMVPGLTADSTLGPVVAVADRFVMFVNDPAGASVFSSPDGQTWTALGTAAQLRGSGTGVPAVAAAVDDGQGGVIAVGSMTADDETQTAAIWQLSGTTWKQATITAGAATASATATATPTATAGASGTPTGPMPAALDSVAGSNDYYVAAAATDQGPRILYSTDGQTWQPASISGAEGYNLVVSSWSNGFIAAGANASGKSAAWTSPDGRFWISEASWKLPANLIGIYPTRIGLLATSTSLTSGTSWWWSNDGRDWQDSRLTSTAGCWGTIDTGVAVISLPASSTATTPPPDDTPTPKPTKKPAGSVSPTPSPTIGFKGGWQIWASKDARTWQLPAVDKFGFDGATSCQVASAQGKVVIVGWAKGGVLRAFYGAVSGL